MIFYRIALLAVLTLTNFCLGTYIQLANYTTYPMTATVYTPYWCSNATFNLQPGMTQKLNAGTGILCCFTGVGGQLLDPTGKILKPFNVGLPKNPAGLPTTCDNSSINLGLDSNGNVITTYTRAHE